MTKLEPIDLARALICAHLAARETPGPGKVADDLIRLAKSRGMAVDQVCEWIGEQEWPLSILDLPRKLK